MTTSTASWSHRPAPPFSVSATCDSIAVGRLKHRRDAALGVPGVGLVDRVLGEQEDVRPASAAAMAARRPATPPPITSTSVNCCGSRAALNGIRYRR